MLPIKLPLSCIPLVGVLTLSPTLAPAHFMAAAGTSAGAQGVLDLVGNLAPGTKERLSYQDHIMQLTRALLYIACGLRAPPLTALTYS